MGDLLFGIHPVCEALIARRRRVHNVYIAKHRKGKGLERLLALAERQNVSVQCMGSGFFHAKLGDVVHQGVAAEVGDLPIVDQGTLLAVTQTGGAAPLVLALDGIVDPQNLGSIIRSARAMGVDAMVLPKVRCAPLSPATSKASAGAMEHMRFARVPNMVSALGAFKQYGCWVVGTAARTRLAVYDADLTVPLVLVVGGEEKGLRPLVRKTCDFLVSIPQLGEVDSLNAAVAGAIVMYEVMRQRRAKQAEGEQERK